MNNFYMELKQNINNPNYLKENINNFNNLNDAEIKLLFDDEEVDFNIKNIIVESCYERIITLPFNIFTKALFYIENPYLFTSNYRQRIENLSFQELIILIYNADLDDTCLIEITKMEVFKKHLNYEKENKIGTKLQSFELITDLKLNNNIDGLNSIGTRIVNLLQNSPDYTNNIEMLINYYLDEIIEKNENIDLDSNVNSIGIALMNYYLKNHKQLNNKLIKFYILFRLKDLNVKDYCDQVIITEQDSTIFGGYIRYSKTLKIFSNYLVKKFDPFKLEDENANNDFLNLKTLGMISHELGHIVKCKEFEKFQTSNPTYEKLTNDTSLYYLYKNDLLRLFLGQEKYHEFHEKFIEETRADIFSIFDSSIQIEKYFKNSFSEIQLQNLCEYDASHIIRFYTYKNDNGEIVIMTPMQKFDEFFESYIPHEKNLSNQINNSISNNIMNNLLLGDQIPEYILEEIKKIASGETITTNIYREILSIINRTQSFDLNETIKEK